MKKLKFLCIAVIAVLCTACPDDPDNKTDEQQQSEDPTVSVVDTEMERLCKATGLMNTTWTYQKKVEYDENNSYKGTRNTSLLPGNAPFGTVFRLSDEPCYNIVNGEHCGYELYVNSMNYGNWYVDEEGLSFYVDWYKFGYTARETGGIAYNLGVYGCSIHSKTSSDLVLKSVNYWDGEYIGYDLYYFTAGDSGSDDSGGNSGGGSSTEDAPEIGFYDYTATKTSLKIQYRIYDGDVSSAKVYYGTSSPSKSVSATVSGKMITARISGLTAGTDYYIKCTAKGSGGSTTSETVRCMTNF